MKQKSLDRVMSIMATVHLVIIRAGVRYLRKTDPASTNAILIRAERSLCEPRAKALLTQFDQRFNRKKNHKM